MPPKNYSWNRMENIWCKTTAASIENFASLDAAIEAMGDVPQTLIINEATTYAGSNPIPTTLSLLCLQGGEIAVNSSLVINGPFSAGLFQVFSGAGAVTFGAGSVTEVLPEWWGALGDGTTDDTAAIQAAITSFSVTALAARTYLSNNLAIPSNRVIRGKGRFESTLKVGTAAIVLLEPAASSSNIEIKDLGVLGTDAVTDISEMAIYGDTVTDLVITGCHFEKINYPINLKTCDRPMVSFCTFYDTSGDQTTGTAILFQTECNAGMITNNVFKSINRHAVYISSGTRGTTVSANTIDGARNTAINFNAYSTQESNKFNIINGNTIRNVTEADGRGISMGSWAEKNIISNNIIDTVAEYGIALEGNATYAYPTNSMYRNIVTGNQITNAAAQGIWVLNASDNTVSDNFVSDCLIGIDVTTAGADIGSHSYDNKVFNNTIRGSTTYGLKNSGLTENTVFFGNKVSGSGTWDHYITTDVNLDFRDRLLKVTTPVSTSGTGEDDLMTGTLAGYYLGTTGTLRIQAHGSKTGTAGNKTLKFYFGPTVVGTWLLANSEVEWDLSVSVAHTASNANKVSWILNDGGTVTAGSSAYTLTTLSTRTIKFTGTCADGGDTITQTLYIVERI